LKPRTDITRFLLVALAASICLTPRSTALDLDGDGVHDDVYKWFYQGMEGMDDDFWTIDQEYFFGWSPLVDDNGDILDLEVVTDSEGKSIVAHLDSVFGIDYRLRSSSDLSAWTIIGTTTGDGTVLPIQTDADLNVETARFWRVDGLGPTGADTASPNELLPFEKHLLGLNLTAPDTDQDGLSDAFEVKQRIELSQSTNPADQERASNFDPLDSDTNGDGIPDGQNDDDGDGLTNAEEAALGTKLDVIDSDTDGVSDLLDGWPLNTQFAPPRVAVWEQFAVVPIASAPSAEGSIQILAVEAMSLLRLPRCRALRAIISGKPERPRLWPSQMARALILSFSILRGVTRRDAALNFTLARMEASPSTKIVPTS